jgi:CheY-like chemotaxis protein
MEQVDILLVDDDTLDRKSASRSLRAAGLGPGLTEAQTLAEARGLLKSRSFHCAVVDFHLPDGEGLALLHELDPARRQDLAFVLVTGVGSEDLGLKALREGAQDYLPKGALVDPGALPRAVRYALERKRSESLRRRLVRAEHMSALGQLIGALAHEINNPLSWLVADLEHCLFRLDQLMERPDTPAARDTPRELREVLSADLEGARRIAQVTEHLVNFTRSRDDEIVRVDLLEVVQHAAGIVAGRLRQTACLDWQLQPVPAISASQRQLVQATAHLLFAALDTPHPQTNRPLQLTLSTWSRGGEVGLEITTDGPGFPPDLVEQVSDPIFGERQIQGGGLGLWISGEIARHHSGQLLLESPAGGGRRLSLRLPLANGLRPSWPAPEPQAPSPAPSGRRLLLIDDEPLLLRAYQRLLRRRGFEVTTAAGGGEAIARLARGAEFDLILCDLMMPEVDGVAFYEHLQTTRPTLVPRLFFQTGGAYTDRAARFVSEVDRPVFRKPLDLDAFEALLSG